MPPLGLLLGNSDFSNKFITLKGESFATLDAAREAGSVTLNYGLLANTIIDFVIVAFAIFIVVKQVNRLKKKPEAPPPNTKDCPFCLSTVPIKASRCGHCTSELKVEA